MRWLDRLQPFALLAQRLVLGVVMVVHGYPKIFGGLGRHYETVGGLGLPPWLAYFSAAAEFFGGIFVALGLLTRFWAAMITINMLVAVFYVHWPRFLVRDRGFEFPLALAAMAFLLIFFGGGPLSVDRWVFGRRKASKSNKQ